MRFRPVRDAENAAAAWALLSTYVEELPTESKSLQMVLLGALKAASVLSDEAGFNDGEMWRDVSQACAEVLVACHGAGFVADVAAEAHSVTVMLVDPVRAE